MERARTIEAQLASALTDSHFARRTARLELEQMTATFADVAAALTNALAPLVVIEFAIEFHVTTSDPDPFAVNAGEIGFAADALTKAAIEHVVPHVQFRARIG